MIKDEIRVYRLGRHPRPQRRPRQAPREWWKYAASTALMLSRGEITYTPEDELDSQCDEMVSPVMSPIGDLRFPDHKSYLRNVALCGGYALYGSEKKSWGRHSRQQRLVVSSPGVFQVDPGTQRYYDYVVNYALPVLRIYAQQFGLDILFHDTNCPTQPDKLVNSMIWKNLLSEIKNCNQSSSGLFFLALQSDMNDNDNPLPTQLPITKKLEEVLTTNAERLDFSQLFNRVYKFDTNAIPSKYVFIAAQGLGKQDEPISSIQKKVLHEVLAGVTFDDDIHMVMGSNVSLCALRSAMSFDEENFLSQQQSGDMIESVSSVLAGNEYFSQLSFADIWRPLKKVGKAPREWWKYIIKSVISQLDNFKSDTCGAPIQVADCQPSKSPRVLVWLLRPYEYDKVNRGNSDSGRIDQSLERELWTWIRASLPPTQVKCG